MPRYKYALTGCLLLGCPVDGQYLFGRHLFLDIMNRAEYITTDLVSCVYTQVFFQAVVGQDINTAVVGGRKINWDATALFKCKGGLYSFARRHLGHYCLSP